VLERAVRYLDGLKGGADRPPINHQGWYRMSAGTQPCTVAIRRFEVRVPKVRTTTETKNISAAPPGFEAHLWAATDALRGSLDAVEYKPVVLGLIFLKYISDAFEEQRLRREAGSVHDPDPDQYRAAGIFWVPPEAHWSHLKSIAGQPTIGQAVDHAIAELERDNPSLRGVLPRDYGGPHLDQRRLGEVIDLVSNIRAGGAEGRPKEIFGRIYEYFLSQFAAAEGKRGERHTPRCIVRLLVEMLEPDQGRVYDPCCGSAGMFVQSMEHASAQANGNGSSGKAKNGISIRGQEPSFTAWRLARMNLTIHGIDGLIAHGDSLQNDCFPGLAADFILSHPPFNQSDWRGEALREDERWKFGVPPTGNANFAWVQHIVSHVAPTGVAGIVLSNGSMSSNQSGEGEIRKNLIEAGVVDCIVALPGQLFSSTQVPACLWLLTRRDRRGEVLFLDARQLGVLMDRTHRVLSDEEITRIAITYRAWRGAGGERRYADVPGFCKAVELEEIRKNSHVLVPGRYVGVEEVAETDAATFEAKVRHLVAQLQEQAAQATTLDRTIARSLKQLGLDSKT
jgi:type I restriction enzyme M protein